MIKPSEVRRSLAIPRWSMMWSLVVEFGVFFARNVGFECVNSFCFLDRDGGARIYWLNF